MSDTAITEELLTWIMTQVEDNVVIMDGEGTILFTNRAWRGYQPEDAVGLPLERILAPEFHEGHRARMDRILRTGESEDFEVKLERPDGEAVWYRGRLIPVMRDGADPLAVGISRDITAERRSEEVAKVLGTLIPLCSWCQRIRTENDQWQELEHYLEDSRGSSVTHGICPKCAASMVPNGGNPSP